MRFVLAALLCGLPLQAGAQSFEAWSARAEKAQKRGQSAEALDDWTHALQMWSSDKGKAKRAKALSARAELEEKAGSLDEALKDLDEAVALDKKSATMFDRRGQVLLEKGLSEKALADFYKATKLNIDYGAAYLHRGQAYEKQGDTEFAREDYKTACRLGVKSACAAAKKVVVKKKKPAAPPPELAQTPQDGTAPKPAVKPAAPAPAPASEASAESAPQEPAPTPIKAKEIKPAKAAKPSFAKIDLDACRASIDSCNEDGNAIDVCLRRVSVCQAKPTKGCCPRACLQEFDRRTSADISDAELFREVFGESGTCKRLIGAK